MSREPVTKRTRVSRVHSSARVAVAGTVVLATTLGAGAQQAGPEDLLRAVRLNDLASVGASLTAGIDANSLDRDGRTALQVAVRYGHLEAARLLLDTGASVDARDADGWTALHLAAQDGDTDLLRLLVERGADVESADPYRYRALHLAARDGHAAACELLIDAGADASARIDVGFTPADLAERFPDLHDWLLGQQSR